jgi:di/tricarboxylate transporter
MYSFQLILVFIVIVLILISLYWGIIGPSFTFVIAVAILGLFKVLTPSEILAGFANEQIAVIIMLLIIGEILRQTGIIEIFFDWFFRSARNKKGFLTRMVFFVSSLSTFINDTPLVAVMMPYVNNWCKKNKIAPSKFLIPLSYAAILGGVVTLIGTSTNLIVAGMVQNQNILPGMTPLKIFDFSLVGLPMMIIGGLYLIFFGEKLLPSHKDLYSDNLGKLREYFLETRVKIGSHLAGQNILSSGFSGHDNYQLIEIIRDDKILTDFTEEFMLAEGDRLHFTGDTTMILNMIESKSGLQIPEVGMMSKRKKTQIVEIVISQNSSFIGKIVQNINFRSKYDAVVISVHRNGENIQKKLSTVSLKAGDVLLLYAGDKFLTISDSSKDFYLLSKVHGFNKIASYKPVLLLAGLIISIILSALGLIHLFMGLIVLIIAALALKITHPKAISQSIDYNLAIIIVLSLALGLAMLKSGAADLVANSVISLFMPLGKIGLLFGIYLITTILAAYITAKAAAALIFPISLTMSVNLGLNPLPFVLIVAYASAANFMTPIGFQTNLMVYGPGNYTFKDFMKVGWPLTFIYMNVTVFLLYLVYLS